jgi:hypothetical protein
MSCTAGHDPDSSGNPSGARGEQHSEMGPVLGPIIVGKNACSVSLGDHLGERGRGSPK